MLDAIKLAATGTGLYSAWLWYLSSKVKIIPIWAKHGQIEPPGAGSASNTGWIIDVLEATSKAAKLNKRAALWTAASILIGVLGPWVQGVFRLIEG